eukprot:950022-Rhodomonas_salina.1
MTHIMQCAAFRAPVGTTPPYRLLVSLYYFVLLTSPHSLQLLVLRQLPATPPAVPSAAAGTAGLLFSCNGSETTSTKHRKSNQTDLDLPWAVSYTHLRAHETEADL